MRIMAMRPVVLPGGLELAEISHGAVQGGTLQDPAIWDVAVIGGGPAGASAALAAAKAGKRVVLLERASLPRYKTCGGGLVGMSINALPSGIQLPLSARINMFTFAFRGRLKRTRTTATPALGLVFRDEFDAALIRNAIDAGVEVREQVTVRNLDQNDHYARLATTSHGTFCARAVVGADGSAGRTAQYVRVQCEQVDLGLELELPLPPEQAHVWENRILIDWGRLPGGYAWVFPKGNNLSVGVIAGRGLADETRLYLKQFLASLDLDEVVPSISSGHLTRCRSAESPLARGRVLVAGDAAGLLEPWTREGISFALRSGRMAGTAAAAAAEAVGAEDVVNATNSYSAQVSSTLGAEMAAGRLFMRAFSRRSWVFHAAIIILPPAWDIFVRIIRGEISLARIASLPVARKLLIWLAR